MINSQKGFSLIEIIIVFGLMGALSVVFLNMTQSQSVMQKKAESDLELNSIVNTIAQNLLVQDACGYTLGSGTVIMNDLNISSIKNRSGSVIFEKIQSYGGNVIKINSIKVAQLTLGTSTASGKYVDFKLNIEFERISKILKGNKKITKSFPISAKLDSSDKLINCYSATEAAVDTSMIEGCTNMGGVYNSTLKSCILGGYDPNGDSDGVAISQASLNDFFDDKIKPLFVKIAGDTMTGALVVLKNIVSEEKICVQGRCRDFKAQSCGTGFVIEGINEDGSLSCVGAATTPVAPAPIAGGWSDWSACSVTCGSGIRFRSCTNPVASNGGAYCSGPSYESCFENKDCVVAGGWSDWGGCEESVPLKRVRQCNNPAPANGGADCIGSNEQVCCTLSVTGEEYHNECKAKNPLTYPTICPKIPGSGTTTKTCF